MDILQAMKERHSVRKYSDRKIEGDALAGLKKVIEEVNSDSGLDFQLVLNDPETMAATNIRGCNNYIVCFGKKGRDVDIGFYGEKIVLEAQCLGLNTCWAGASFSSRKCKGELLDGYKRYLVIAVGYGETQGHERKTKKIDSLCSVAGEMPDWFKTGMEAAMNAPTAINQQKFKIIYDGNKVTGKILFGPFSKLDFGIVKYHFETASGHKID